MIFNTRLLSLLFVFVAGLTIGAHVVGYNIGGWFDDKRADAQWAESRYLANKFALLEARLARVDALGQRLVMMHDLSTSEFDFDEQPGIGGFGDVAAVDRLHESVRQRESDLRLLKDFLNRNKFEEQTFPNGWPVKNGWVSSDYGRRINPFTRRSEIHRGIDIAGQEGSEVYAVASGVVTKATSAQHYGLLIEIDHGGKYRTRYAHNKVNLVKPGDVVRQGEVIALLGNTGRSTGAHLHFEVLRDNRHVPPRKYLSQR